MLVLAELTNLVLVQKEIKKKMSIQPKYVIGIFINNILISKYDIQTWNG